jgi:hypothetical protein
MNALMILCPASAAHHTPVEGDEDGPYGAFHPGCKQMTRTRF